MKQIIKKGYKIYKTKCLWCDCKFTYELEDTCEGSLGLGQVRCPHCGKVTSHSATNGWKR